MLIGILAGLATGALWGLTFVAPRAVAPFSELDLAVARYMIFGLASLALMVWPVFRPTGLSLRQFWIAVWLGLVGYVTYYVALAYAVKFAGAALPPLIIGLLPVALAIIGNWQDRNVSWRALALPLVLILSGLALVNVSAFSHAPGGQSASDVALGAACATFGLLVWISYAVINARVMRAPNPPGSLAWTGLQGIGAGLATLPLIPLSLWLGNSGWPLYPLTSPEGVRFASWSLALGIAGSWFATWFWIIASRHLPLALSAQLIIAETLFALLYGFLYEQRWPTWAEGTGATIQMLGVVLAVAIFGRAAKAKG